MTIHILAALLFASSSSAATKPVLAGIPALQAVGAKILGQDKKLNVGYAQLSEAQRDGISKYMHSKGKCGGYEVLSSSADGIESLLALAGQARKSSLYTQARRPKLAKQQKISDALEHLTTANIQSTVQWLSSFHSRYNGLPDPNQHVNQFEARLKDMFKGYSGKWSVQQIKHDSTRQNSLMVHIEGAKRPSEIVVFGGHLDSINMYDGDKAPGADDNASGSAAILEAMRVLLEQGAPERSLEFFWYAGEESGLLGSAEIAETYKSSGKNVVAVLQLDMTMFPGSGEQTVSSMTDFTSPWMRDYLVEMNKNYLNINLVNDECGYACSDHASWFRQGFPTLMPFESTLDDDNKNIHSEEDVIDSASSFTHALIYAKIALIMAMDLGNSTVHPQ
jgi:leucyl aminopeptidase